MSERRLKSAIEERNSERQRIRLAEIVAARSHSPYYRELSEKLPEWVDDTALLPATKKNDLMARFDDWVTDREVTLKKVNAFILKRELIGERFLGKYLLISRDALTQCTSSS